MQGGRAHLTGSAETAFWEQKKAAQVSKTRSILANFIDDIYPYEDSENGARVSRVPARPGPLTVALSRSKLLRSRPLINFRRPRRHFEGAFSLDLAVLAPEPARPSPPGRLQASFFESETIVFWSFFRMKSARREKRLTSTEHCKNQYETHFGATAQQPKIDQKSIEAGLKERSASRSGLESVPGRSGGASKAFLGRLEAILGRSWPLLARPGRPQIGLGAALERPKAIPGASGCVPEAALGAQTCAKSIFYRFSVDFAFIFVDFRTFFSSISTEGTCDENTKSESQKGVA